MTKLKFCKGHHTCTMYIVYDFHFTILKAFKKILTEQTNFENDQITYICI